MTKQSFEIYSDQVLSRTTGANIHKVTGCLATIRNYIFAIEHFKLPQIDNNDMLIARNGIKTEQKIIFELTKTPY
jgi:hypothetical protein